MDCTKHAWNKEGRQERNLSLLFFPALAQFLLALRATDLDWELARNGGEGTMLAMIEFSYFFWQKPIFDRETS